MQQILLICNVSTNAANAAQSATEAAASVASAAASAGGGAVVTASDTTPSVLNTKLLVAGGLTKAVGNAEEMKH